jgi:hypothetical protein
MTPPKKVLTKESFVKNATVVSAYILVVWGFYRLIFRLPEELEELVVKPIIWLLPIVYQTRKEGLGLASIGITLKNIFPSIYFSLGLGAIFVIVAVIANFAKYGGLNFGAALPDKPLFASLGLSFATAFTEEVTFRGYLFNRLWLAIGSEWWANAVTSTIWVLIHVPILIFVWKFDIASSVSYLLLTGLFGVGSAFIFARTKNVFSSVFLHVLWEWPIILFR